MNRFAPPTGSPVFNDSLDEQEARLLSRPSHVGEKRHVHHTYIWLNTLRMTGVVIFVALASSASSIASLVAEFSDFFDDPDAGMVVIAGTALCLAAVILIAGISLLFYWLSYKNLFYVVADDEFNLYKGILNKTRVHVPYNKIQSVDQKATLLQRIAGVRTVYIDTAGGASNKVVVVPYLTKHDAEWLRSELFARKGVALHAAPPQNGNFASPAEPSESQCQQVRQSNVFDIGQKVWDDVGGIFAGGSFQEAPLSYEYGLSNKELLLAGLSNRTSFALILLGIVVALSQAIGAFLDLFPGQEDNLDALAYTAGSFMTGMGIVVIALFVICAFAVIWIISIIGTCIGFGGFKAGRRGNRIEVQYGLLQHTFQGVDIDRVQSIVITQSFIRRIFGYCEISLAKVDAMSEGDKSSQNKGLDGIVVHPFVKVSRVPDILAGLIPEFNDPLDDGCSVAPVALRRALVRKCIMQGPGFWLAVVALMAQLVFMAAFPIDAMMLDDLDEMALLGLVNSIFTFTYIIAALATVASAVNAVLWARNSSFAFDRSFMRIVNGGFSISTTTIPKKKIQFGYIRTNPLQRLANTATVSAQTAAGIGGTTVSLFDVADSDANAWLEWLEPHASTHTGTSPIERPTK